ncbi:MAG: hypothetical protein KAH56_10465 [Candidatus Krumholzibacteria bacterium]|nr:hypothetical protein [Candidatus Krumholzibacteria bacterium]
MSIPELDTRDELLFRITHRVVATVVAVFFTALVAGVVWMFTAQVDKVIAGPGVLRPGPESAAGISSGDFGTWHVRCRMPDWAEQAITTGDSATVLQPNGIDNGLRGRIISITPVPASPDAPSGLLIDLVVEDPRIFEIFGIDNHPGPVPCSVEITVGRQSPAAAAWTSFRSRTGDTDARWQRETS